MVNQLADASCHRQRRYRASNRCTTTWHFFFVRRCRQLVSNYLATVCSGDYWRDIHCLALAAATGSPATEGAAVTMRISTLSNMPSNANGLAYRWLTGEPLSKPTLGPMLDGMSMTNGMSTIPQATSSITMVAWPLPPAEPRNRTPTTDSPTGTSVSDSAM